MMIDRKQFKLNITNGSWELCDLQHAKKVLDCM